jgi:hypothetical protein
VTLRVFDYTPDPSADDVDLRADTSGPRGRQRVAGGESPRNVGPPTLEPRRGDTSAGCSATNKCRLRGSMLLTPFPRGSRLGPGVPAAGYRGGVPLTSASSSSLISRADGPVQCRMSLWCRWQDNRSSENPCYPREKHPVGLCNNIETAPPRQQKAKTSHWQVRSNLTASWSEEIRIPQFAFRNKNVVLAFAGGQNPQLWFVVLPWSSGRITCSIRGSIYEFAVRTTRDEVVQGIG